MSEWRLNYNCGPVAKKFHDDVESRVKLLIGPFGTGKTTSAAWDLIMLASRRVVKTQGRRRSRFAVVRNTYPELRDTTIRTYLDWFPPLYFGKYNTTEKRYDLEYEDEYTGEPVEVELLFKALDSEQDVRDLLSLELTGAHIEEVREIHETVFQGMLGRVGRFPSIKDTGGMNPFITPAQVVLTTNFPPTSHWLHGKFVEHPVDGYAMYRQTQEENRHNLRPGYYEDLEKDYADRPDMLRTLVRGDWGVTVLGRIVYPEFKRDLHVATRPLRPQVGTVIRGWDNTGLSPACVVTQISPTGQWLVLKEFVGKDSGILDFTEMVVGWCNQTFKQGTFYRDIADPAGNSRDSNKMSPSDYMKKLGVFCQDGIQTFKVRREVVAGRLSKIINGEPALVIDPACRVLIDGFDGGYAYPEIGASGVYKTEPAKNEYSHIHDALQYPATKLFMQQPQDPRPLRMPSIGIV